MNKKQNTTDKLLQAAKGAEERGEWRLAADKYLHLTLEAPSKWTADRWNSFAAYSRILQDTQKQVEPRKDEYVPLKCLSKDTNEPILFRAQALVLRGVLAMQQEDDSLEESAAIYFRRALYLISQATTSESSHQVKLSVADNHVMVSVADQLQTIRTNAITSLEFLQDASHIDEHVLESVPKLFGRPNPSIVKRLVVGGDKCDCCGKRHEENEALFARCIRCKKAYYCSTHCQQQQWHAGHKQACRAQGQIEKGDLMTLKDLVAKPEYNGRVVKANKPVSGGRWAVSMEGRPETLSIATEKLSHIRPAN